MNTTTPYQVVTESGRELQASEHFGGIASTARHLIYRIGGQNVKLVSRGSGRITLSMMMEGVTPERVYLNLG